MGVGGGMKEVIYEKTEQGWDEINNRTRRLSGQLRTLLVVIDGQRSVGALMTTLAALGVSEDSFRSLESAGLIGPTARRAPAPVTSSVVNEPIAASVFSAEALAEIFGEAIDRNFGLSRATYHQRLSMTSTREDFRQLAMDIVESLKISRGNDVADEFWESVEARL